MSDIKDNLSEKEIVYYKINFLKLLYINDKRYYKCMDYHTFTYPKTFICRFFYAKGNIKEVKKKFVHFYSFFGNSYRQVDANFFFVYLLMGLSSVWLQPRWQVSWALVHVLGATRVGKQWRNLVVARREHCYFLFTIGGALGTACKLLLRLYFHNSRWVLWRG